MIAFIQEVVYQVLNNMWSCCRQSRLKSRTTRIITYLCMYNREQKR